MAILSSSLGLDLGSHSLKAVELRQSLRGIAVVQLRELPRSDEAPLEDDLREFLHLHSPSRDHVVCALPSASISCRSLTFPFGERKRLAQAVPFEIDSDLPFEISDYVVDWDVAGERGGRTHVVAVLAPRTGVSSLLATLDAAGCPPRVLEAEGLALANLTSVFDLPGNQLLMDIGHRKTTFCVLVGERAVLARSVPLAGLALTEALARDRDLTFDAAEVAKRDGAILGGAGAPGPAVSAVLDQLAREMLLTLGAAEPQIADLGDGPAAEVTLIGGSAQIERLDSYLGERTGLPVSRISLPIEGRVEGLAAAGSPAVYAPAIALALRATGRARTRMNFRQDEFAPRLNLGRYREDFRWTGYLAAAAAVFAILNFGTATTLDSQRVDAVQRQISELYAGAFPGKPVPTDALSALRSALREANERADFLGVYPGNLSALDLLTEISQRIPKDLDVVLEELTIDRQLVRMRVYSKSFESADRLRTELSRFDAFASVRIGSIETDRKTGGKRFNVTISLTDGGSHT